ncbi:MAG: Zn-ribbon domain-containing OB-fold protein [Candidatus Binatia bacterium]
MTTPDFPIDDPEIAPFWDGCRSGELRIPRCEACGRWVWYPRRRCPACGGSRIAWRPVSGRGRLFTWVTVHRAFVPALAERVPYVTALVELEEDRSIRLATILDVPSARELRLGLPVEAFFEPVNDRVTLPRFRVRDEPAER